MGGAAGTVLVVGADGSVGRALLDLFRARGRRALGTSRRPDAGPDRIRLDLLETERWAPPAGVSLAFLCAAASTLEACRRDPEGSAAVNVRGSLAAARALASAGARVVALSSDRVFDGTRPRRRAEEPPCPVTDYGRQKAALEEGLRGRPGIAVARLTKVLAPDAGLLAGWAADLRAGRTVRPLRDATLAPLSLAAAAAALADVGERGGDGLYPLSGREDVSYAEAAARLARRLGADSALVAPTEGRPGLAAGFLPPFTSLNCARAAAELDFCPPSLDEVLETLA
ncbi:MAG: sugar nucleotide-binding protein [Elusimicrobia bacterium]|nr:sugar nucleotide-binding protein [Elusimicrobiota bacterium]